LLRLHLPLNGEV